LPIVFDAAVWPELGFSFPSMRSLLRRLLDTTNVSATTLVILAKGISRLLRLRCA
jgi:hypothetical protein